MSGQRPPVPEQDPEPDHEAVARKILLDQLTGQARSRHELADRLARRNVPDDVAEPLLDRFTEVGLIDDEAFARAWVDSRRRTRGLARPALAQELRRKGVANETVQVVLGEVDSEDEEESARLLVRKKLRSLRNVEETVAARRLTGMLARKGYSAGVSYSVVRQELGASDWGSDA
ncbi:regulatory protein RecX [Nocardioides sp. BGMRC 2183]|nr:regulatory protein RecX [Nocardioides sp. BGMRC 2183]